MHEEQTERRAALAGLRRALDDGLASARLSKKLLAARAGLSRTTVQLAFQTDAPAPSAETVAALSRALGLPVQDLLEQRRIAAAEAEPVMAAEQGPGAPISQWDPHDLEVHPAGTAPDGRTSGLTGLRTLPSYVPRAHDRALAQAVKEAVEGRSRMVIMVGTSSTGKTRACWEAVQPLAEKGWRLWHPFEPARAEAALEGLHRVQPRTVVWLNEAQHYFGDSRAGEHIAATLHGLLTQPDRAPVLVLGTLWPGYAAAYSALPHPGGRDPHSRTRELLAGRTVTVPEAFDARALSSAADLAQRGDQLLADVLARVGPDGRVTQDLAGAPELLFRYEHCTPAARAVLEAAMDARRLGVGLHLPQAFLTDAAVDYLSDTDFEQLGDDWAEAAFAELAHPVHGKQAPLRRSASRPRHRPPGTPSPASTIPSSAGPVFRLADYLEQHGRTSRHRVCPQASFWHAAHARLTHPDDLSRLAIEAEARQRLQWAHCFRLRAAEAGSFSDVHRLMLMHEAAGDWQDAEALAQQAADNGDASFLHLLARRRQEAGDLEPAETLYWKALHAGDTSALTSLATMHGRAGNREKSEALYQQAADAGETTALLQLGLHRERAGNRDAADAFYQQAADGHLEAQWHRVRMLETAGDQKGAEALAQQTTSTSNALCQLALLRETAGNRAGAEALAQQAADNGDISVLGSLALTRLYAGDRAGVEALAQQVAHTGNADALYEMARALDRAGNCAGAEVLFRQALDAGAPNAWFRLAQLRARAGDLAEAEALARQAVKDGEDPQALHDMAKMREWAGDLAGSEALWRKFLDAGDNRALHPLAFLRERAGDREGAEALAQKAANAGSVDVLCGLARMREQAGLRELAEPLYKRAADAGDTVAMRRLAWLRERAGDREDAEALAQQAADSGSGSALYGLLMMREEAGDREGAEALARQLADAGRSFTFGFDKSDWRLFGERTLKPEHWWPYGLDPDGTPTLPWQ